MDLPNDLIKESLTERKVYYFSSDSLNTSEPHYYILIKKTDDDVLILSCCTSQFEKRKNFIESRNLPYETLVWINQKESNVFAKDTYVDCNDVHEYSMEEFLEMFNKSQIDVKGEVSEATYEQIIIGLHHSPRITEEIKELIPKEGNS